ncbi:MAG: phosphate ABC transporter ATP-binding protein PstB [Candidatus Acetothermia bacterium]|jgi:phosphate transport system ATP-binding protein|nr:phosphate ABC transporter ATP-binding protein PstB [Candidatus Acetothermia bacterium]
MVTVNAARVERTLAQVQDVAFGVRNLSFYYGREQVLRDVTLDIPRRRVTAVVGPSGCGKSTFLRVLNRLYELVPGARAQGEVWFSGVNILDPKVDVVELRRRIGMVFQKPNPFPKSVYENVAYGPRIHGVRRRAQLDEIVERALRRAALWDEVKGKLRRSAFDLSGGQQQRLCIARALAMEPEVLLMDEPTSALDPTATARIEDLIAQLKADYTVVIVTHNMQQAARTSDLAAVFLTGGVMVEYDVTKKIFENPTNKLVEDYVTGKFG